MGLSQYYFQNWSSVADIIDFSFTLDKHSQIAFLVVFSAFCWTIWKIRNDACFQHINNKTFRTIVLMIVALVNYWAGMLKRQAREIVLRWMPTNIQARPWGCAVRAIAPGPKILGASKKKISLYIYKKKLYILKINKILWLKFCIYKWIKFFYK